GARNDGRPRSGAKVCSFHLGKAAAFVTISTLLGDCRRSLIRHASNNFPSSVNYFFHRDAFHGAWTAYVTMWRKAKSPSGARSRAEQPDAGNTAKVGHVKHARINSNENVGFGNQTIGHLDWVLRT